jgi:O-antigen ligase
MDKKIDTFVKQSLTIFIILLPIALITGPFLSDLIISLCSIIFIFYCIYFKNFKYFNNNFFKFFLIFYLLCLVSALLSDFKLISSLKSFFYFRFGVFAIAFYFVLTANQKLIKLLFISLFLCFLILILDGFFEYITGANILGNPKHHELRLSSFFGDELIYGSYLVRLLPILIALFFLTKFSKQNNAIFLFFLLVLFTLLAIFLSGERASFFLSILLVVYLIIMINKFSKYFFLCLSSLLILISISAPQIKYRMFDHTMVQLGLDKKSDSVISPVYKGHFLIAKELFKSNKFIGVGPKNYRQYCYKNEKFHKPPYACTTHPHNSYIQLLAETGFLGFLIIFSLFIFFSISSIKHIYLRLFRNIELYNFPTICLMASVLITLWPLTTSGSIFNNYINIFYFFPVGILLYQSEKTKIS